MGMGTVDLNILLNQLPHLSGRWVPRIQRPVAVTVACQPLDRILSPWLANPRNPAIGPHYIPGTVTLMKQWNEEK